MIISHNNIFPIFVSEFDLSEHECNSLLIEKIDTYYEKKDPTLYNNSRERFFVKITIRCFNWANCM